MCVCFGVVFVTSTSDEKNEEQFEQEETVLFHSEKSSLTWQKLFDFKLPCAFVFPQV